MDLINSLDRLPDTPILDVVRVVIADGQGKVLLVKEYDDENWKLPGGKIEKDETILAAIKRELMEELACDIADEQIVRHVKAKIPHSEHYRYIVKILIPSDVPQTTEEVVEVLWANPDDLPASDFREHISTAIAFVAY